jgi:hypothetical protein
MSVKCQIIDLTFRHALIGTWTHPDESAEYTVSALGDICTVSGVDPGDGESFIISDVSWDGSELRFTSLMPSTEYELRHVFRVVSEKEVEHEWTRIEPWIKKISGENQVA